MTEKTSLIQFPCHFPIKIIGNNSADFAREIKAITHRFFPETPDSSILFQESQQARYLSITVTVYVHDQATLDAFYQELTKHPDIKMVL